MKALRQVSGNHRRAAVAVTGVVGAVLGWASLSWACGLYVDPPTGSASPNRLTATGDVTVTGSGWQPGAEVVLSLSTDGVTEFQPLGKVAAAADGRVSTRVRVAGDTTGVYYLSLVQGSAHANVPIEVTGAAGALAGDRRAGLTSGSDAPGLTSLRPDAAKGTAFPWAPVLIAGAVLALCGALAAGEVRRKRATR